MIFRDALSGEEFEITPRMVQWLALQAAVDEVGADDHTDQHRHESRAALFKNVDRQIRARVAAIMPQVLTDARASIDRDLGIEKITEAVRSHRRAMSEQLAEQRTRFDGIISGLVDDALRDISNYQIGELAKRCKRAIGSVVAREVSLQLARFLKTPPAAKPAKKRARR